MGSALAIHSGRMFRDNVGGLSFTILISSKTCATVDAGGNPRKPESVTVMMICTDDIQIIAVAYNKCTCIFAHILFC